MCACACVCMCVCTCVCVGVGVWWSVLAPVWSHMYMYIPRHKRKMKEVQAKLRQLELSGNVSSTCTILLHVWKVNVVYMY